MSGIKRFEDLKVRQKSHELVLVLAGLIKFLSNLTFLAPHIFLLLFISSAAAAAPAVTVLYPNGGEVLTERYVPINWTASDPDNDTITLTIYYDTNRDKSDGRTLIASSETNDGTYLWDLTGVACGYYYVSIDAIAGVDITTDYSDNAFIKAGFNASYVSNRYAADVRINNAPYVEVTACALPVVRGVYPVKFNVSDPDGDVLFADIYYSEVQGGKNHTIAENIVLADFCNDSDCRYNWNTTNVNGDYYIDIVVTDGFRNATNSSSIISVDNEIELTVLHPNGGEHFSTRCVDINWTASDIPNFTILLTIYYDNDTDISNGRTLISANEPNDGTYVWDLSAVSVGDYYVSIDAVSSGWIVPGTTISITTTDYSDGHFTTVDNKPQLTILHPNGGEVFTSKYVDVNWTAADRENWTILLDIYYDNDNDKSNGRTLISANEPNDGNYVWDTSSVSIGNYYISIDAISSGVNCTGYIVSFISTDYSDGSFVKAAYMMTYTSNTYSVTVNKNTAPFVEVIAPDRFENINGTYTIKFNASDAEEDILTAGIYYSEVQGNKENTIVENLDLADDSLCARTENIPFTSKTYTTQSEWESGVKIDLDTFTGPGDVKLLQVPENIINVALISNGGSVSAQFSPEDINDGDITQDGSSWGQGFGGCSPYSCTAATIILNDTYLINKIVMYWWDADNSEATYDRDYDYELFVSTDLINWTKIAEKDFAWYMEEETFPPVPARYVKIEGKHNTANTGIHLIEAEVYGAKDFKYSSQGTWSNTYNAGGPVEWDTISWNETTPSGTKIAARTRTALTEKDLSNAVWSGYYSNNAKLTSQHPNRWIEVEVNLSTTDGNMTPVLHDLTLNYAVKDNVCYYTWDTSDVNGEYYIDVVVSDSIYNTTDSSDNAFSVHNIPVITNVSVSNITTSSAVISWHTSEPTNSTVEYGLNVSYGASAYDSPLVRNHSVTLTTLNGNRLYHFRVRGCDDGDCAYSDDYTFVTVNNLPVVTVLYPNGGEVLSSNVVDINWTASDADNDSIRIDVYYDVDTEISNGRALISGNEINDGNYTWNLALVNDGTYYISIDARSYDSSNASEVTATDYSDNSFSKTTLALGYTSNTYVASVNKNTAPYVNVIAPNGFENINGTYTINFNVSDAEGDALRASIYYSEIPGNNENPIVEHLDLYVLTAEHAENQENHPSALSAVTKYNCSYEWDTTQINGKYYIDVVVTDSIHNSTDSSDNAFSVTNVPVITTVSVSNITTNAAVIAWHTTNNTNSTVEYGLNESYGSFAYNATRVRNHTIALTNLSGNKLYHFRVRSCDAAGNCVYSNDSTFITLNNLPVVTVLYPNGGEVLSSKYVDVNWTASDADNDTIKIDVYYDIDTDRDNGRTLIAANESNDGVYEWNLAGLPNGTYSISIDALTYDLQNKTDVKTTDYSDAAFSKTSHSFTYISNTYNATVNANTMPAVTITGPKEGDIIIGTEYIEFNVSDPEGDFLYANLNYAGEIYKRKITVTNTLGQDLEDYPVLLTIDTAALISAGKMRPDAIKVKLLVNETEVPIYIEDLNTHETKIWFALDLLTQEQTRDDIYLYYGDSTALAMPRSEPNWANLLPNPNFLRGKPVISTTEVLPDYPATNSNDGSYGTKWVGTGATDWLKYTLGEVYKPYRVYYRLTGSGIAHTVSKLSPDGENYIAVADASYSSAQTEAAHSFKPAEAQYFLVDIRSNLGKEEFYEVELYEPRIINAVPGGEEPGDEVPIVSNLDLSTVWYDPDSTSITANNCSYLWNMSLLDGVFCINVEVTDLISTVDDTVCNITIDNINDYPVLIEPIPNQTWFINETKASALDLDDYFYDPNGDLLNYTVRGNETITVIIDPLSHNVNFSQPYGWTGSEQVIFSADDGNRGVTDSNTVSLAVTAYPPVITNVTNSTPTVNAVTITWDTDKASDSLVKYGTTSGDYTWNVSNARYGTSHVINLTGLRANTTYYYVVNSTDVRGNSNESSAYNFTTPADVTPPVVNSVTLNNTAPNMSELILVTVNATDNVGVTNVTAEGVELIKQENNRWNGTIIAAYGLNYVNVSAKDAAGNYGYNNTTCYTGIDNVAPVVNSVELNTTAPELGDLIVVTVNATDNIGVTNVTADGVALTFQGNNIWNGTIAAQAGFNRVNVSARDAAGNYGYNTTASYTTLSYGVIITTPAGKTTYEGVNATYELTVTNTGNAVDAFYLQVNNLDNASVAELNKSSLALGAVESQVIRLNVTNNRAGVFNVTVTVYSDNVANTTANVTTIVVAMADIVVSDITWTPLDITEGDTVTFNATIKNNGTGDTSETFYNTFSINGSSPGGMYVEGLSAGTSTNISQRWIAAPGSHVINVFADSNNDVFEFNETNNNRTESLIVMADTTPPTVSIISPPDGATVNKTVSIIANASDNIGVSTVEFYIDDELKNTTTTPENWWNASWHYRKAITINNAGNTTLTDYQALVTVDTASLISEGKMNSDGSDVKFTDSVTTELSYWIECGINTNDTKIWVKVLEVPANGTATIYMYYGYPSASSESDFDNTMQKLQVDANTVALWHFDEGSGTTVYDEAANNNDGTIYGATWQTQDGGQWDNRIGVKFSNGSALQFDGSNDYVDAGDFSGSEGSEGSFEVWFKPNIINSVVGHAIISKSWRTATIARWLVLRSDGSLDFDLFDGSWHDVYTSAGRITVGQWYHAVATWGSTGMKLYLNGILVDNNSYTGSGYTSSFSLVIGEWKEQLSDNYGFNGTVDEVAIYSRALSADEIKAHYERRKYISPEPTISLGTEETSYSATYTWSWNTRTYADGNHTIKVIAYDSAENNASDEIHVTVSYVPPSTPVITSPVNNTITNQNTINVSGTADAGTTVEVFVNGTSQRTTIANEQETFTFTTINLTEGINTITATATDGIQTSPHSEPVNVIVDTIPPTITIISPVNDTTCTTTSVNLNYSVNEPTVWEGYSLDGAANVTLDGNTTLKSLSIGSHSLTVYANDTADTMNSSAVWFTVNVSMQIDLIVADITYPSIINDGDVVNFNATISNRGTEDVTNSFDVAFSVDENPIGSGDVNGLLAGENISVSQTWAATPGNHTISVFADADNDVIEMNESNNNRSEALPGIEYADLIVVDITRSPGTFEDGELVTFNATIKNNGTGSTSRTFYNSFYIDGSSIGGKYVYGLSAGSSINVTQTWTATSGNHTIKVQADSNNDVSESNETNNERTESLPGIEQADLIVTNITWTPTTFNDGDTVTFNAMIENIGAGGTSRNFYVGFKIDESYSGNAPVRGLSSGASASVTQTWSAKSGEHNVTVVADRYNYVSESNESNNSLTLPLGRVEYPDLIVTNITWTPGTFEDGDTVTFTAAIKNNGTGSTSRTFYNRFYIDRNAIGGKYVHGLKSGSSINVVHTRTATAGNHTIKVRADSNNDVSEFNETNNEKSEALPTVDYPDFVVENISWTPSKPIYGDTVSFSANISNIGVGNTGRSFRAYFYVDDSYIGSQTIYGLDAGSSINVDFSGWTATPGEHELNVKADAANYVSESNESNNELIKAMPGIVQADLIRSPNGNELWYDTQNITWNNTIIDSDSSIKIELYDVYSFKTIAEDLSNTGLYQWDTKKLADGSDVPDGSYYKIRIAATDPAGDISADISDSWFTIYNTYEVLLSSYGLTTTEKVNATYTLTITNNQPYTNTFDLIVKNTDNASVAELDKNNVTIPALSSDTVILKVTDDSPGTYKVVVNATSQTKCSVSAEVIIRTKVLPAFGIAISTPRTKTSVGGSLTYMIEITNNQRISDVFALNVTGINPTWVSTGDSYTLIPGERKAIPLVISLPDNISAVGIYTVKVDVTSSNINKTKNVTAPLIVVKDPIIFNLLPANNTRTGSRDVLFSWETSVNSTSVVFIKNESEMNYTSMSGYRGIYHTVLVNNLTRNSGYEFYVMSNSSHGSATSEPRDIYIDNGITFDQRVYNFRVARDYDQKVTISVTNTDDDPHDLLLTVNSSYDDIIVGFVGAGSMDKAITLNPSERNDVTLVIHAQDAVIEDYVLSLNLTNLGAEIIQDYAHVNLYVRHPYFNFSLDEVSSDPDTLIKRFRVKNLGDPVTDLEVFADDNLRQVLIFNPAIDHAYLGAGSSIEFDAIPVLSLGSTGTNGTITVQSIEYNKSLDVNFGCCDGKKIFLGAIGRPLYENLGICFSEIYDNDNLGYTNPKDNEIVDSYLVDGTLMFKSYYLFKVTEKGKVRANSKVQLEIWDSSDFFIINGSTDEKGYVHFFFRGLANNYSYKAKLQEFNIETSVRKIHVNTTPKKEIFLNLINWLFIKDNDTFYDLSSYSNNIELDNFSIEIKAYKDSIENNSNAILYLMSNKTTMAFDGEINNDSLFFNILFLPSGSYSSKIVLHSTDNITISPIINISISDTSLSDKEFNTFFSTILPYNSSSYLSLNVSNVVLIDDPKKMIELTNIKYAKYEDVYTYSIKSTTDINDTLIVKILDESNNTLFQEDRSISLKKDEGFLLDIHVPVFKNDSERLNRYSISIRTLDEQELKSFVEKDSFTVSFGISVTVSKTKVTDIETGKSQGYHEICIEGGVGGGIFKSKEIGTTTSAYDDYGGPYVSASGDIAVPVGGGSTGSVGILTGDETSTIKKTKGIAIDGGVGIGCAFKGHRDVIPRVYWQDWPPKDRNLFEGTAGHDVEELQKKLKEMGHDPGPIDGIFGPRTEEAIKEFQEDHGLDVDGIVGPNTKEMIDRKSEEGYHKPQRTSDAPVMKSYKSANWYCTNKPVIDSNSPLDDSIKKHDKYVDPFIKDYCGHRAEFLRKLSKLGPITYIIGVVGEVTGLTGSPVTTLGPEVVESSLTSLKAAEEFQRMADDPPDSNYKEVFELEPYENYVPLVNNSLTNALFDLSNRLGNHTNILKALRVSIERYQGAFEADSVYYQEIQISATRKYLNLSIKSNEEIINAIDNLYAEIVNKGLENYSRDDFIAFQERISSDGFNETELHRLIDLGLDSSGIEEFRQSILEINAIGLNDNIFITFVDTKNLIDEANEYEIVWLNKSYPFSNIVKALLKINFRLPWSIDTYRPHDVYVLVNGYQVGELLNTVPNGQYVFEVDPYYLNYADYSVAKNTITLKTLHLNGGHYVVSEDMELIFYLSHIEMPVCAANQSEADDIVLRKSNVIMNATDLATYSRDIMFSNEAPMESELIEINTSIINLGVTSIRNLPVQFFDGEPAEGVQIGEQLIDSILPFQEKLISITWNTTGGDHDIYVVVDPNNEIEETDEYNNKAFKTIVVQEAPDTEKPVIVSATASPDTIEANGTDTTLLNVTATDNVGITGVTVDLSAIGYGIQEMTNNSAIWQYTTTAAPGTSPGTYYLQVKASDAAGNYNDSVSIELNVTKDTTPPTITNVTATNITSNSAIITWDTDEPSDSVVKYGVESGNYTAQEYDTANVTSHSIDLISLDANTTYYYVVNSTDQSGNTNESTEYNFTTTALDTTPPIISNVTATNITSNSAIITWNTDEISDSLVKYGVEPRNYTLTGYNATGVTSHIADLTGLNASTTYYYVVNSTDQSNNSNQSIEHTFTTLTADTTPPTITIHSPEPRTYNTTNIIALTVSADEELNSWWHSLNEGRNLTFAQDTTITARIGSNGLIVYANDTSGNVGTASVRFAVSTTNWADDFAGWSGIVSYKNITVSGGDVRIRNATRGSLTSIAIIPSSMTDWSTFYVNDTALQRTNVTYKLLNASDNSTVCAMSSSEANAGLDIASCASGVDSIRLYADLTTADASYTPVLHDWNVSWTTVKDETPPTITIDTPTESAPVYQRGGAQFWVNFTYSEEHPANYSVDIRNSTAVINTTGVVEYPPGGTNKVLNVSFYLNSTAADGWYNVTVEMYDTASNWNITSQNYSVVKDITAPTVTINFPTGNDYLRSKTIEINITATDTNLHYTNISIYEKFGCYDNKTKILTSSGWKFFGELRFDDEIFTLNQDNKRAEWKKPERVLSYNYSGEMFHLISNDFNLLVSPEHKVYGAILNQSSITSNPSSPTTNNLPLNSLTSCKRKDKAFTSFSGIGGWILTTMIPNDFPGGYKRVLKKSESLVISTDRSSPDKDIIFVFVIPFGPYSAGNPFDAKNLFTDFGIFSSSRNFKSDIVFTPNNFGGIFQGFSDHPPIQARILFQNPFNRLTSSKQLNNITDHYPGSLKDRFSMTNLRVSDDISHNLNNSNSPCINNFSLMKIEDLHEELSEDKVLIFLDSNFNPIVVNKIEKVPYKGKIYDVTVPNHIILVKREGKQVWSGNSLALANSTTNATNGTFVVTLSVSEDGEYTITATTYDLAGNSAEDSINITVETIKDTTPPAITIHSPEPRTYNTTNIIALTVSADEELNSWWYSLNEGRNLTFAQDTTITAKIGSNELIVYANDTSGNVGTASVRFAVSTTNWADDFAGWSGIVSYKNITVSGGDVRIRNATRGSLTSIAITPSSMTDWSTFYVNDTALQRTNVTYKLLNASDNSTVCAMSSSEANAGYDISSCASGVDSIRLYADLTTADASYTPVLHDWNVSWIEDVTAALTITILSPVNGTTYITNSVDLNYTVNEPTAWEGYSLDSGENVTLYGNTTLTDLAEGTHTLMVYANDTTGNMNSSTVWFAIDTIPPTIESVTLDAYKTIPDAAIHVTVETTDNVGVTAVTADGVALVESESFWEGNITALSTTGSYTLAIRAEDAAGNFAETAVDYSVVKPGGSIGIGVDPRLTTVSAGDTALITIKLVSTENFDDIAYVYLTTEGVYPGYEANITWFNWTSKYVSVPAGAEVNVPLEASIPAGESGYKMFYAKLESTKWTPTAMDTGILYTI